MIRKSTYWVDHGRSNLIFRRCGSSGRRRFYHAFFAGLPPWFRKYITRGAGFWVDDEDVVHSVFVSSFKPSPCIPRIVTVTIDGGVGAVVSPKDAKYPCILSSQRSICRCPRMRQLSVLPGQLLDFAEWLALWALKGEEHLLSGENPPHCVYAINSDRVWSVAAWKRRRAGCN